MRRKHVGVDSFYTEKAKLLDAYDRAKDQNEEDAVRVDHGAIAESGVRSWLGSFLPKRFGVTKGYIITPSLDYDENLEEWDVIIFDALESPILYTRGEEMTNQKRAIPIEYVRGVIEVKATLTPSHASSVSKKLLKLRMFMDPASTEEYPKAFQFPFVCAAVFMETKVSSLLEYRRSLDEFVPLYIGEDALPFLGSLVLRSQVNAGHVGFINAIFSDDSNFLAEDVWERSNPFRILDGSYGSIGCFSWCVNNYQMFIFDLLACLSGKKRQGMASSFYGLDLENVEGSRLFH